ncbi:MAG TPA: M20 family metallopeptidase [Rubricoccaceae bacterium]|jgi:hippurate hydrolase
MPTPNFLALATAAHAETVRWRRHLHRHPELSFQEHETAAFIAATLREIGLAPIEGVGGTGVVAHVHGARPGPVVALRADIDALPIDEATGLDFASTRPGVMHACGHDVHTASLLAAARMLHEARAELAGTVRLVFQPGEELIPGGALAMIEAGVLGEMDGVAAPVRMFGQHVAPPLPAGTVGVRSGPFMASADELYLTVRGTGGHAADPAALVDVVLAQAQILVALQSVIARNCPPGVPSILSFGRVEALGATNILPDEARLTGTFRSMDEAWRKRAHTLIRRVAEGTAAAFGATVEVEIRIGYPALVNDAAAAAFARETAVALVGEAAVVDVPMWFASEDFAHYAQRVPAAFSVVGVGSAHGLHTPRLLVDEAALVVAPALLAALAWRHGERHAAGTEAA